MKKKLNTNEKKGIALFVALIAFIISLLIYFLGFRDFCLVAAVIIIFIGIGDTIAKMRKQKEFP